MSRPSPGPDGDVQAVAEHTGFRQGLRMRAVWLTLLPAAAMVSWAWLTQTEGPLAPGALAAETGKSPTHPVPIEKSNCVTCHVTAGRELTDAVYNFARSAHDLADFSCQKCHGGNLENDAKAHEQEFGFIGNKLTAHMKNCRSCHTGEAATFRKGPHHWDHDKQINTKYPLCVDCHGNHDIGKPPEEFRLTLVCLDCHKDYETKFPNHAIVTAENDRLWESIRAWQNSHASASNRVPEALQEQLDTLRAETAALIHPAREITPDQAEGLMKKVTEFRRNLEAAAALRMRE